MHPSRIRRSLSLLKKPTTTLIVLVLVLLGPGATRGGQAGAQETTFGRQTAPQTAAAPIPPKPNAESWVLVDTDSGLYLAGDNPDEQLPIGSVTKIMTALVILNEGVDPNEEVTVPKEAEAYVGNVYSNVGLIAGERLTVRDLLKATLIPSGTDAAYTLAEDLGSGSVDNFVGKMNDQAALMSLKNTHFETPAGLDTSGNYSSARDLATITRAALKYPLFAEIVDTKDAQSVSKTGR